MRIQKKLSVLAISAFAFTNNTSFSATNLNEEYPTLTSSEAILEYWTPERLKNATPMELPTISAADDITMPTQKNMAQSVSVEGAAPEFKMRPDLTPLFTPKKESQGSSIEANDYGTDNLLFSSTRLVPLTADLTYPYSAVGKIFFTKPNTGNSWCSASVIANRIVATAGHCVYSKNTNFTGYHTNFVFIPAFRDGAAPFQKWTGVYALTTPAWIANPSVSNLADHALIEVKDNTISGSVKTVASVVGKLGYATNKLASNHLTILGYPCNFDNCTKMHQINSQNGPTVSNNNVKYGSDMGGGGSSGGPWIQNFGVASSGQTGGLNPGRNQIVAVLSWGYPNTAIKAQGASTLGSQFQTIYNKMCAHKAGNC